MPSGQGRACPKKSPFGPCGQKKCHWVIGADRLLEDLDARGAGA